MPTPWFNTSRVGEKATCMAVLLLPDKAALETVLMQYIMVRPTQTQPVLGSWGPSDLNGPRIAHQFVETAHMIGICKRHRAAVVVRSTGSIVSVSDFRMLNEFRNGLIPFVERTAKEIEFPYAYRIFHTGNHSYCFGKRSKDQVGKQLRLVLNQQFPSLLDGTIGAVDLMTET